MGMILCGTDLSPASEPAVLSAAAYAKKRNEELLLVHVVSSIESLALATAEIQLEQEAAELRRRCGITVTTRAALGAPDDLLLELAQKERASLIVVGALGSSGKKRALGSVPERLCQSAGIPVLVARNATGMEAWCEGSRPLNVLLGSGLGDASRCALRQIAAWPDLALTVAHIAWPYGEHYRLGIGVPMPLDHLRPEVHRQLLGDLGRWVSETPSPHSPKLRVTPGWGRIDSHLAQLAHEKEADLVVVGNHQRNLAERIWHGSVSRHAIHEAGCNVLCVPHLSTPTHVASPPRVIVVPTDFSALSDRAIALGYSLLERGGVLHLVHVRTDAQESRDAMLGKLRARVALDAESRGLHTEVRILEGSTPWLSVWQYAGRANADLICMGTHSKDAVKSLVLGSQAQALLQHSRIPVVLVPPDRES
jgi:nucleotide-binding universal stress UspA family protein